MKETAQIGNIVAKDYRSASIFRKYGIDFCCGGGKTLESVCQTKGIDIQHVLSDLLIVEQGDIRAEHNFNNWSLDELIDHIIEKHHAYTKTTLVDLGQYLRKVAKVHGNNNPELIGILRNFELLSEELVMHMQKEEMILFPYIKELSRCKKEGSTLPPPPFGTVRNPVQMMESEHDKAGNLMKEIRALSSNYTPPVHACNTYMVAFKLLDEFENDLHEHIHLENNILFTKAIEQEKDMI